ncbi:MAG: DUF58 domain-containing protein [Clostridiales Family XIII bacterium]|nr:DUF58 domain-containing protein [Clostridiales Family XIII bacterium]
MTRGRFTYLALLAGLFILHVMLVDYISYYIIIFFLFLPCLSLFITFAFFRDSVVEMRVTPTRAGGPAADGAPVKGDEATLELRVTNSSLVPIRTKIDLAISNELVGDGKGETIVVPAEKGGCVVKQPVSFGCPGKVSFRIDGTGVYDPLGLFCLKTKHANNESAHLIVFPEATPIAGIGRDCPVSRDVENDGLMRVVKGDDPSELYDIREYRPGDLVTRISWKLSHKSGRLMVKEHGRVVCGDVLVMLDMNGGRDEADALLTALASIFAHLSRSGVAHDIEWYSAREHRIRRDHIAAGKDGGDVLSSILSEGGLQSEPSVLYGRCRGEKRNPYSKIIALCSSAGMADGELPLLMKSISGAEASVLFIESEENNIAGASVETGRAEAGTVQGGTAPRILRARPADIAAALRDFAL